MESSHGQALGTTQGIVRRWPGQRPLKYRTPGRKRREGSSHRPVCPAIAGVLSRNESGQVEFPYEAVKVEFLLQAA